MAVNDDVLGISARLDTTDIERGYGVIKNTLAQTGQDVYEVNNIFKRAAQGAAAFFTIQQAQAFARQIALVRGEFQQLEVAFRVMLGSEEKAVALMNQLVATAAKTPFDLQGVAGGAKQLLAYGMEAERINETLIRLGDIAAGLSIPLGDLVYLFGTTMTQGRLYMQDFNQFMGRGIPIADELAKQFGVTKNQVRGLVEEGKIGFPQIEKAIIALTSEGGKFSGLMEEQSKTITGQISNIGDSFSTMLNDIGRDNEGIINGVLQTISTLIGNYETIGKVVGSLIAVYGTYKTALIVQAGVTKALTVIEEQAAVSKALLGSHANMLTAAQYRQIAVTKLLQAAQRSLIATMKGAGVALMNPYVLATAAVVGLGVAIYKNVTAVSEQEKATKRLGESTSELNKLYAEEKYKVDELFDALKNTKKGTEEHEKAKNNIINQYGEYLTKLGSEKEALLDVAEAYKVITDEIWKASKAKMKAKLWEGESGLRMEREQEDRASLLVAVQEAYADSPQQRQQQEYLNIIKRIEEGQDRSNGAWVNELAAYDNEIATLVNRLIMSREQYNENIKLYSSLYGDVEEEQKTEAIITGTLRNKKYWEQFKKEKEEELAAMTPAAAASEKAEKIRSEILKAEEKLSAYKLKSDSTKSTQKEIENTALETRQLLLDLEDETTTKRIEQIHLNYDKEIAEVKKKEKELKEARGGQLTEEDNGLLAAMTLSAEANKAKALEDIRKEELQSMRDYLMEYGSLEQQRLAIAEEYAEKIAKAQTEGEKAALRVQQAQAEEELRQRAFSESFDWSSVFQDLQGHTVEYLISLRDQLQDVLKNGGLDPEQMAIAQEKLRELNDEISRSGGIFDFVGSRQREQIRREQEAKDAKDALTAAQIEQGGLEMRLSQAKLLGAPTDKVLALEKQLADAREKTAKATALAKEKEDSAKESAADALARWFVDAQQFIAEKGIDQLPELLNSIGLGSLGEKAAQGLSAFNNASGAVADYASGNYIGAALKGINAIKDFGGMLGIGGGNAAEVQATIDRLSDRNEILTRAIEDLTEELEVNRGAMTIQAAQEAMRYQEEKNQNLKEIAQTQAGYHNAHHSWNYYWNGFSQEFVKEFSKRIGRSWSGDIWELTAEEMDELLSNSYAAELIKGTGKGGYGERVYEKLEDYAAEADKVQEILDQVNETFTGMSFNDFRNSFIDNLMDMEKSAEDIFDDMAEYYQRAMLSRAVGEKMYEDLEAWYNKYAEAAKDGEGLTQAEIDTLNKEYQALIKEGIKKRDEIAKITGYDDTFKDAEAAAAKGIQNITSEQANALEGRITAMQIAQQIGNEQRLMIMEAAQLMQTDVADIRLSANRIAIDVADIRDTQTRSLTALHAIRDNTSVLPAMAEDLSRMRRDINEMK